MSCYGCEYTKTPNICFFLSLVFTLRKNSQILARSVFFVLVIHPTPRIHTTEPQVRCSYEHTNVLRQLLVRCAYSSVQFGYVRTAAQQYVCFLRCFVRRKNEHWPHITVCVSFYSTVVIYPTVSDRALDFEGKVRGSIVNPSPLRAVILHSCK